MKCPCLSKKSFEDCCEPFLDQLEDPKTAEQLMRSRYTAFAKNYADYLVQTHHPKTKHTVSKKDLSNFCKEVEFFKLEVHDKENGLENDTEGFVSFKAYYRYKLKVEIISEKSYFEKVDGLWKYEGGEEFV